MLKSDRLVCEKNATITQPVTNYNLDPSILIMKRIYQSFVGKFATIIGVVVGSVVAISVIVFFCVYWRTKTVKIRKGMYQLEKVQRTPKWILDHVFSSSLGSLLLMICSRNLKFIFATSEQLW